MSAITFPVRDNSAEIEAASTVTGERLFNIQSRAAASLYEDSQNTCGYYPTSYNERGPISSIRLLYNSEVPDAARNQLPELSLSKELAELKSGGFRDFFLTNVDVSYTEKVQIFTTFGDTEVTHYFGKSPVIFNLSGVLFDSLDHDWFTKFFALYGGTLRGSQLARNYELLEIILPNLKLVGTIMALSHQQNANSDTMINFTIQFLAKEVTPLPSPLTKGLASNEKINGSIIDFNVGKKGFGQGGFGLTLKDPLGKVRNAISSSAKDVFNVDDFRPFKGAAEGLGALGAGAFINGTNNQLKSLGGVINDFKSSVFSPVYGILSTITKVIKTNTGDISKLLNSFTNPVNTILRDVQSVANEAIAIANLLENSVNSIIRIPERTMGEVNNTISTLRKSAGVITRVPETMAQSLKRVRRLGRLKGTSPVLSGSSKRVSSKTPLLNSGSQYKPGTSYNLPL